MKILKTLTGAFLLSSLALQAQVTSDIVGYETITIKSGQYNLMGVRLLEDTELAGSDLAYNGTAFTSAADFSSLTADTPYQLEINSGDNEGVVIAVELNTAGTGLELHELYASSTIPDFTGAEYKIRKAATLGSIFGEDNSIGLQSTDIFSKNDADEIVVKHGGTFETYFHYSNGSNEAWIWDSPTGPQLANQAPLLSTTGFFINRKDTSSNTSDIELVIEGNVKESATFFSLTDEYNYIGSTFPAGTTLENSRIQDDITHTDIYSLSNSDNVMMSDGAGGYTTYAYYKNGSNEAWITQDTNSNPVLANDVELQSGIIIVPRSAATTEVTISDRNYN